MGRIAIFCIFICFLLPSIGDAEGKLHIVTTNFPVYDWIVRIVGDREADVFILQDDGIDLHNYQPSAQDIIRVTNCDVCVYVGGASELWIPEVLAQSTNGNQKSINLLNELESYLLYSERGEADEHIWLSLNTANKACEAIADVLCQADPDNALLYSKNCAEYLVQLEALNREYAYEMGIREKEALVFADRFPFRYLARDYNLSYYAVFDGCGTESEISFDTIIHLAQIVSAKDLEYVFVLEGSDYAIAETVLEIAGKQKNAILRVNDMQAISTLQIQKGISYLDIMRKNLEIFKEALQ